MHRLIKLDVQRRTAVVQSAIALNENQQAQVRENLSKIYGNNLNYTFTENSELIGGMKLKVGSDVFDGSVRTRLTNLQESF